MFWGVRYFHSSSILKCAAATVDKSLLSKLRKSTGYSISNCKKALQLHNNDVAQAEKWLIKQAQAEGWAKATKLSGRATSQGLIGVSLNEDQTVATLLELNCETDFVARNEMFKELTAELTDACLNTSVVQNWSGEDAPTVHKESWNKEQVSVLPHSQGKSLADRVAIAIGLIGENMSLSRAMKVSAEGSRVKLYATTHPQTNAENRSSIILGRYAGLVAVKSVTEEAVDPYIMKQLCLQVIGMNPESIGTAPSPDEIAKEQVKGTSPPETEVTSSSSSDESSSDDENDEKAANMTEKQPDDKYLLRQKWLADEEFTVAQVLEKSGVEILDFVRLEVGETNTEAE